ncbi:hypothetical protein EVAR_95993_1 [Eumeta japonica]|uniref:Uncharacterized protein n=1 Tax=Eumeta variegata TaxID=151549 RepID=A0A4C1ZWN0_EUMVA|nr:hypothetical protein EVAR_95993_1 [Eumeta japonica]
MYTLNFPKSTQKNVSQRYLGVLKVSGALPVLRCGASGRGSGDAQSLLLETTVLWRSSEQNVGDRFDYTPLPFRDLSYISLTGSKRPRTRSITAPSTYDLALATCNYLSSSALPRLPFRDLSYISLTGSKRPRTRSITAPSTYDLALATCNYLSSSALPRLKLHKPDRQQTTEDQVNNCTIYVRPRIGDLQLFEFQCFRDLSYIILTGSKRPRTRSITAPSTYDLALATCNYLSSSALPRLKLHKPDRQQTTEDQVNNCTIYVRPRIGDLQLFESITAPSTYDLALATCNYLSSSALPRLKLHKPDRQQTTEDQINNCTIYVRPRIGDLQLFEFQCPSATKRPRTRSITAPSTYDLALATCNYLSSSVLPRRKLHKPDRQQTTEDQVNNCTIYVRPRIGDLQLFEFQCSSATCYISLTGSKRPRTRSITAPSTYDLALATCNYLSSSALPRLKLHKPDRQQTTEDQVNNCTIYVRPRIMTCNYLSSSVLPRRKLHKPDRQQTTEDQVNNCTIYVRPRIGDLQLFEFQCPSATSITAPSTYDLALATCNYLSSSAFRDLSYISLTGSKRPRTRSITAPSTYDLALATCNYLSSSALPRLKLHKPDRQQTTEDQVNNCTIYVRPRIGDLQLFEFYKRPRTRSITAPSTYDLALATCNYLSSSALPRLKLHKPDRQQTTEDQVNNCTIYVRPRIGDLQLFEFHLTGSKRPRTRSITAPSTYDLALATCNYLSSSALPRLKLHKPDRQQTTEDQVNNCTIYVRPRIGDLQLFESITAPSTYDLALATCNYLSSSALPRLKLHKPDRQQTTEDQVNNCTIYVRPRIGDLQLFEFQCPSATSITAPSTYDLALATCNYLSSSALPRFKIHQPDRQQMTEDQVNNCTIYVRPRIGDLQLFEFQCPSATLTGSKRPRTRSITAPSTYDLALATCNYLSSSALPRLKLHKPDRQQTTEDQVNNCTIYVRPRIGDLQLFEFHLTGSKRPRTRSITAPSTYDLALATCNYLSSSALPRLKLHKPDRQQTTEDQVNNCTIYVRPRIGDLQLFEFQCPSATSVERNACHLSLCVSGAVYIVGGRTPDDDYYNALLRYAPAWDEWRRLRPLLPAGDDGRVNGAPAAVHGQNLYLVGGWNKKGNGTKAVRCYNLETRQAQPPRGALTGGFRTSSVRRPSRAASYRPKSPTADERSCANVGVLLQEQSHLVHDMSVPRAFCAAGVLGGALVVAGGDDTNSVELYDLAAGQWRAGPALLEGRWSAPPMDTRDLDESPVRRRPLKCSRISDEERGAVDGEVEIGIELRGVASSRAGTRRRSSEAVPRGQLHSLGAEHLSGSDGHELTVPLASSCRTQRAPLNLVAGPCAIIGDSAMALRTYLLRPQPLNKINGITGYLISIYKWLDAFGTPTQKCRISNGRIKCAALQLVHTAFCRPAHCAGRQNDDA